MKMATKTVTRINSEKVCVCPIYAQTKHQPTFRGIRMCGMANNGGEPNISGFEESINFKFDDTNVNIYFL